jgi:putative glycosyltransferase (TIGR04372 family)
MRIYQRSYGESVMASAPTRRHLLRRTAWRYGLRLPAKLVLLLAGIFIVVLLRAIRPMIQVRIGILHNYVALGHLAYNNEVYLRQRTRRPNRGRAVDVFLTGAPANRQLLTMIKRRMLVIENRLLVRMVRGAQARTKWSDVWMNLQSTFNRYDEFNNIPPQLSFTAEEESKGRDLLRIMGIEPGSPFVCFHARDDAYRKSVAGRTSEHLAFSGNQCRDCSIHNYLPAAEYLASQGLYALRMGSVVAEKIKLKNNKIINYAEEFRSDFGDVYLIAKCKFFLAHNSGPYSVALAFGVPIVMANLLPIEHTANGKDSLFIPKKLWYTEEKRFLNFPEIVNNGIDGWQQDGRFTQAGIEVIESTSDEVLALAREMNARLDGTWVTTEEDEYLQQRYRNLFPPGHTCYGFPSRVGAEFLRQNRVLVEC